MTYYLYVGRNPKGNFKLVDEYQTKNEAQRKVERIQYEIGERDGSGIRFYYHILSEAQAQKAGLLRDANQIRMGSRIRMRSFNPMMGEQHVW